MKEPRSHIEGATPSTAIWSFGMVPDPFTPPGRQPDLLNRRIPVDDFLSPGTIEWHLDRVYELDRADRSRQTSQGSSPTCRRPGWPSSTRPSPAIRRSSTGPAPSTTR